MLGYSEDDSADGDLRHAAGAQPREFPFSFFFFLVRSPALTALFPPVLPDLFRLLALRTRTAAPHESYVRAGFLTEFFISLPSPASFQLPPRLSPRHGARRRPLMHRRTSITMETIAVGHVDGMVCIPPSLCRCPSFFLFSPLPFSLGCRSISLRGHTCNGEPTGGSLWHAPLIAPGARLVLVLAQGDVDLCTHVASKIQLLRNEGVSIEWDGNDRFEDEE